MARRMLIVARCVPRLRESIFIERYLGVPHVLIALTQLPLRKRLEINTLLWPPLFVAVLSVPCIHIIFKLLTLNLDLGHRL